MSCVLGVDLSTRAVDLVRLDESSNRAQWDHLHLEGRTALERLRQVPLVMPRHSFYDDVYLVAVEEPMSRGQPGTSAKLNRVLGALVACVPATVELWLVRPADWRKELGLPGNATKERCAEAVIALPTFPDYERMGMWGWPQDAIDAYAVALYARNINARALVSTRETEPARQLGGQSIRSKASQRFPRLCPTCWREMKLVDGSWECAKHGKPTRP